MLVDLVGTMTFMRIFCLCPCLLALFALGCETTHSEDEKVPESVESNASIEPTDEKSSPEEDETLYTAYSKAFGLSKLERASPEPPKETPEEFLHQICGDWKVPEEVHNEVVAFLCTKLAMTEGEIETRRINPIKDICEVVYSPPLPSPEMPVIRKTFAKKRFQVEKVDGEWQIRCVTVALPDMSEEPGQ